jgi:hypothetical protein
MKRLTLSLLLGVFCLALLAVPTRAGLYDPTKPPPRPYTNSDSSWGDPTQARKAVVRPDNQVQQSQLPTGDSRLRDCGKRFGFWQILIKHLIALLFSTNHNSDVVWP